MSYFYRFKRIIIYAIKVIATFATEKLYHKKVRIFVLVYSAISFVFCITIFSNFKNQADLFSRSVVPAKNSISFLDVGQGDAIFIQTSEGHRMLIDAGNVDGKSVNEIHKLIPWYDRRIDLALGTHADQDHVGGFTKVLKSFTLGHFLFSDIHTTKSVEKILFDQIAAVNVATSSISRGAHIEFGTSGVSIDILYPTRMMKIKSDKDTNLFSIIAIVTMPVQNGIERIMLTGDAPQSIEKLLINSGDDLHADILKAGHHGSRTSTSAEFVDAVDPEIAIISAGKNNRYGHPHKEVIDIFSASKIEILETSKLGTIKF